LRGAYVTENAFAFYGGTPLLGRTFAAEDAKAGVAPVFVMAYQVWKSEFQGDTGLIGKTFVVDTKPKTLIGIMPAHYEAYGARIWMPLESKSTNEKEQVQVSVRMMGRLKTGTGLNAASAEMNEIFERNKKARPNEVFPEHATVITKSAMDFLLGPYGIGGVEGSTLGIKTTLYATMAGVLILLLIACSNAANLLLVRGTGNFCMKESSGLIRRCCSLRFVYRPSLRFCAD